MVKSPLEIEPPLQINFVYSTKMFRMNIKTTSATLFLVSSTLEQIIINNSGRYNRLCFLSETQYGRDVTDMRRCNGQFPPPPPVFPRGRIRPAHFFPVEETD